MTQTVSSSQPSQAHIVDVRSGSTRSSTLESLRSQITSSLRSKTVPSRQDPSKLLRSIPTLVLYDNRGLDLFEQITHLPEYYLTNAEIDVLVNHAQVLVENYVPTDKAVLIELGVGSMRKTRYLLQALVDQGRTNVKYYALDLEEKALNESVAAMQAEFPQITFIGLLGTYDDALPYIRDEIEAPNGKMLLWLGSSIGNLTRPEATKFMADVSEITLKPGDYFLIGMDQRNAPEIIRRAYNDPQGVTREFIMNGLSHVNAIFNQPVFDRANFAYETFYNIPQGRHEAYYRVLREHSIDLADGGEPLLLNEGELIWVEYSYKYSAEESEEMAQASKLTVLGAFQDSTLRYSLRLFQKPPFFFEARDSELAPSLQEWETLWSAWDTVTLTMIGDYNSQPISLRHPFIFYVGHIPTFLDVQLSRCLQLEFTAPLYYSTIFERGIDPDMNDPTQCHSHSLVPTSWPALEEILDYRDRVRARARSIITKQSDASSSSSTRLARTLFMTYEHEAMHLETLLYMMVNCPKAKIPRGVSAPILIHVQRPSCLEPAEGVKIDRTVITLGIPDHEDLDMGPQTPTCFGWDNEWGLRNASVDPFIADNRKVSIGDYLHFLEAQSFDPLLLPESWGRLSKDSNSHQFGLKTVFGLVPLKGAILDIPVSVSGVQAQSYAKHHGKRLPTEGELCVLRTQFGPTKPINSGFRNWMPQPMIPTKSGRVEGLVSDGWEWTSTVFEAYPGFSPSKLYPGYSADFFDGKHLVLLGASWATVPRIAERPSFRNWYQSQYPYVFSGFRCVASV